MKRFQGFESIEIEALEDGVVLRQDDNFSQQTNAVFIPAYMIRAIIKAIRDEANELGA